MKCPRCGGEMRVDSEINVGDGKPIIIYYCPKCGEMANKG